MRNIDRSKKHRDRWARIEKRRRGVPMTREGLARAANLSVHTVNKAANPARLPEVGPDVMRAMERALDTEAASRPGGRRS